MENYKLNDDGKDGYNKTILKMEQLIFMKMVKKLLEHLQIKVMENLNLNQMKIIVNIQMIMLPNFKYKVKDTDGDYAARTNQYSS